MSNRGVGFPSTPRTDFGPAPPGYIPGIGRGAVGFTTRSDIGPAAPMQESLTAGRGRFLPLPASMRPGALNPAFKGPMTPAAMAAVTAQQLAAMASNVAGKPDGQAALTASSASSSSSTETETNDAADEGRYSDSKFDSFSGYDEKLFAAGPYDAEDEEADRTYAAVEDHLDQRRRRRREEQQKKEEDEYRKKRPRISEQFQDLREDLAKMKEEEWAAIPEPLDISGRNKLLKEMKAKKYDQLAPMPDTLLQSRLSSAQLSNVVSEDGTNTSLNPASSSSSAMKGDLTSVGKARGQMLGMKLDRASDSVTGQTSVDPKGYLTSIDSLTSVSAKTDLNDVKKARILMKSVIQSNPTHAVGWISAARLEKECGKLSTARQLILKGCEHCPHNEDVWLEAAALHNTTEAKAILARAVKNIPSSITVWMYAANLEDAVERKRAVFRRALEVIPTSVKLWRAAVELEDVEGARVLLHRAVELVPAATELWLALARVESYENAKTVLNRARKAIPTDMSIWICAAQLEETKGKNEWLAGLDQQKNGTIVKKEENGDDHMKIDGAVSLSLSALPSTASSKPLRKVLIWCLDEGLTDTVDQVDSIIKKAVNALLTAGVNIDRDQWLSQAEQCGQSGFPLTCRGIINHCISLHVEEQDRKNTWLADVENYKSKESFGMARHILCFMTKQFPNSVRIWTEAADLERRHGEGRQSLHALLQKAVACVPQAEDLWLLDAKQTWQSGDVAGARKILDAAFIANPDKENIWLAAYKVEFESRLFENAQNILRTARQRCQTPRIWMKSAKLERILSNSSAEHALLSEGLTKFPVSASAPKEHQRAIAKLCLMLAEYWHRNAQVEKAREVYKQATSAFPQQIDLWLCWKDFELSVTPSAFALARSILADARSKNSTQSRVWCHSILLENAAHNPKVATQLLAKALKDSPKDGRLWAFAIEYDPPHMRKRRTYDALTQCPEDTFVLCATARVFWHDGKIDKARSWFQRAVAADKDNGDAWTYYLKFELQQQQQNKANSTSSASSSTSSSASASSSVKLDVSQSVIDSLKRKMNDADPCHGELWQRVSKRDRKESLQPAEIGSIVATELIQHIFPQTRILVQ